MCHELLFGSDNGGGQDRARFLIPWEKAWGGGVFLYTVLSMGP